MKRVLLLLFISVCFSGLWGCNNYPGTVPQGGNFALVHRGKKIAYALNEFHAEHDRWPQKLSDLVQSGLLSNEDLLYPRTCDLPDKRDFGKIPEQVEWIYLQPKDGVPQLPVLMAPLPYTSVLGKRLKEPERILVWRDTVVERRKEYEIPDIIRMLDRQRHSVE